MKKTKNSKRFLSLALAFMLMLALIPAVTVSAEETPIRVIIGGHFVTFADQQPVVVDGRTLAPLRFVAEAFGGTVDWVGEENMALITME